MGLAALRLECDELQKEQHRSSIIATDLGAEVVGLRKVCVCVCVRVCVCVCACVCA